MQRNDCYRALQGSVKKTGLYVPPNIIRLVRMRSSSIENHQLLNYKSKLKLIRTISFSVHVEF